MPRVLAVADDLTGAAEAAAELAGVAVDGDDALRRTVVLLGVEGVGSGWDGEEVVVLDTDSRALPPERLADVVGAAHRTLGSTSSVIRFKKIDSQLRGSTGAELRAWSRHGPLVVAPALPALGRVVVDGALRLPEPAVGAIRSAPIPDVLGGRPVAVVPLELVESGAGALTAVLERAAASGTSLVVDATSDEHLDLLATALLRVPSLLPAGSGGLAAAFGRVVARGRPERPATGRLSGPGRRIAVVVGSIDPAVPPQLEHLQRQGTPVHIMGGDARDATAWRRDLDAGCAVVAVAPDRPLAADPAASAAVLVERLHPHLRDLDVDLVLTGGETARRVLDALGEKTLRPTHRVHAGAVVSLTGSGRLVATRPGSFGGADSIAAMIAALRSARSPLITTPDGSDDHA